jgi:hypothetical protein
MPVPSGTRYISAEDVDKSASHQAKTGQHANLLGKCNFLASRHGRYTPQSDRLLRCRETTLWATFCRTHSQQKQQAIRGPASVKLATGLPSEA